MKIFRYRALRSVDSLCDSLVSRRFEEFEDESNVLT